MASEGPNSAGTITTDDTVGTSNWTNPTNAGASDNSYATVGFIASSSGVIHDESVKIVKGDVISGNENETQTNVTGTDAYYTFGGETDLWGLSWTAENINASDFGVAISYSAVADPRTYYLKCTNFGFSIPTGSTIDGIKVESEASDYVSGKAAWGIRVDHIRITVYSTAGGAEGTNQYINIGDEFKQISEMYVNIGDVWKPVSEVYVNVGDVWRKAFVT